MNCYHCNNCISDKPWIIYGNEDASVKNICGYLCSKRCPDITHYNNTHIMNSEDFDEYRLFPIIPKKEVLKLLNLEEISKMNDSQKDEYDNHLQRMFAKDENNENLYEEHMEIEMSYQEETVSSEEEEEC
jgi:hypothetical protein